MRRASTLTEVLDRLRARRREGTGGEGLDFRDMRSEGGTSGTGVAVTRLERSATEARVRAVSFITKKRQMWRWR